MSDETYKPYLLCQTIMIGGKRIGYREICQLQVIEDNSNTDEERIEAIFRSFYNEKYPPSDVCRCIETKQMENGLWLDSRQVMFNGHYYEVHYELHELINQPFL